MGEAAEIASWNVKEQVTDLLLLVEVGRLELRSLFASIRGQEPVGGATYGFREGPVTASARRCP
jgi:hypothetical protein